MENSRHRLQLGRATSAFEQGRLLGVDVTTSIRCRNRTRHRLTRANAITHEALPEEAVAETDVRDASQINDRTPRWRRRARAQTTVVQVKHSPPRHFQDLRKPNRRNGSWPSLDDVAIIDRNSMTIRRREMVWQKYTGHPSSAFARTATLPGRWGTFSFAAATVELLLLLGVKAVVKCDPSFGFSGCRRSPRPHAGNRAAGSARWNEVRDPSPLKADGLTLRLPSFSLAFRRQHPSRFPETAR